MLPAFDSNGNLPPGIHEAEWTEIVDRFGITPHRRELLRGFLDALQSLRDAGCLRAYLDGSFVTNKKVPVDFDGCWEIAGVDARRLDPVLLDFENGRAAQKARFGGELFLAEAGADELGTAFVRFFQQDRSGELKGIVSIDLKELP
ncbi:MAG TPA: hypothetical protein VFY45_09535 [Baekduia sp.]|nr:hypothetical protein [Baekduia sp.]